MKNTGKHAVCGNPCFMLIATTKTYETLEASKEWNSFTIVDLEVRRLEEVEYVISFKKTVSENKHGYCFPTIILFASFK